MQQRVASVGIVMGRERGEGTIGDVHGMADVSETHFVSIGERHSGRREHEVPQCFLYGGCHSGARSRSITLSSWLVDEFHRRVNEVIRRYIGYGFLVLLKAFSA